jgi:hypothetical protein
MHSCSQGAQEMDAVCGEEIKWFEFGWGKMILLGRPHFKDDR